MQKIVTELSIEETFDLIQEILDNPDVLLMKCNRGNGVMGHMLEKMRSVVVAALNNEEFNDAPGEYEVENFVQELMLLPYLIVQDDTDKIWTYAAAIVILASNYLQLYPNEKLQRGISTIYTLLDGGHHFQMLIIAADMLLNRCEQWSNSQIDLYGISDSFTQRLLRTKLKEEEKENASSSNS